MDEDIVRQVLSFLEENERKSFANVNHYYFDCIYKAGYRKVVLTKQNNLIYYLIYPEFREQVERLIRSPLEQLNFHSFDEKYQPSSRVIQAVIDAVKENRYLPHAWEGFALPPPSLPLRDFIVALPEARSLQFCSIVTTDLIFVRFLQPALKKVKHLSIYSDYTSSKRFLTETFSFLEGEGDSLGLQSLTLTGFSDSVYTLPFISTLKQLVIRLSSMTLDPMYEENNHEFDSIEFEVNTALRDFKLGNVRTLKFQHLPIEDVSVIHKISDVTISFCSQIRYFPAIFPVSEKMTLLGRKLFVDITTTTALSLFCHGLDRLDSSFRSNNSKELRKFRLTGLSTSGNPESISFDQSSIVCNQRDHHGEVCRTKKVQINHFQLSSIIRIPRERRFVQIFSPEGEQYLNFLKDSSNISINIFFEKFYGER